MGSIMCMGVATANSILVVSFAKERLEHHGDALQAAIEAGFTRFRPVIMTALAMIIGMVPMALGLGEGGEQNAPLGPRGDRRPALRDGGDAVLCSGGIQPDPQLRRETGPRLATANSSAGTSINI